MNVDKDKLLKLMQIDYDFYKSRDLEETILKLCKMIDYIMAFHKYNNIWELDNLSSFGKSKELITKLKKIKDIRNCVIHSDYDKLNKLINKDDPFELLKSGNKYFYK